MKSSKVYFILSVLMLMSVNVFPFNSMPYDSIVTSNKQWNILEYGYDGEFYNKMHIMKLGQDTLIDTVKGKVVLLSEDSLGTWKLFGVIWEIDQEVFYKDTLGKGGSMYNFNVEIGDTVSELSYLFKYEQPSIVISVDTVIIQDIPRKRIGIEYILGHEINDIPDKYWIEGIGSLHGLLYSYYEMEDPGFRLLCAYKSDLQIYQDTVYNTCYYQDDETSINGNRIKEINLFPNPTNRMIYIDVNQFDYCEVYNMMGVRLLTTKDKTIDLKNLESGIYFVNIKDKSGQHTIKKVLLEK
ncbi:T9SS type A sorting domain-containing protein [Saccharicrinis sp. FJH54]|uniref:T9SS type A sorting domain-containing protein n=1 Tax=Saccharicrinis sp. FJH54 TaxID=3344665 RepID=UPI0035D40004